MWLNEKEYGLSEKGCDLSEKGCGLVFHLSKPSIFQVETVEEIRGQVGLTLYKRLLVVGGRALLTHPPPPSTQHSTARGFHMSISSKII